MGQVRAADQRGHDLRFVAVYQHPVPRRLDVGGDRGQQRPQRRQGGVAVDLHDPGGHGPAHQRRGRTAGDDAAVIDHDQPVAELGGLVHVVGGDQQRPAQAFEAAKPLPDEVAGLGVEPGRRLVEHHQVGVVDQRPGDQQPALHAPRKVVDLRPGAVGEPDELQQLVGPAIGGGHRQPVIHAKGDQVLTHQQFGIQGHPLGDHADPGLDLPAVAQHVEAQHLQRPRAGRRDAGDHPDRGGFAGAVGAEHAKAPAGGDVEVDAVDRHPLPEPFGQAAGPDRRRQGWDSVHQAKPKLGRTEPDKAYPDCGRPGRGGS